MRESEREREWKKEVNKRITAIKDNDRRMKEEEKIGGEKEWEIRREWEKEK